MFNNEKSASILDKIAKSIKTRSEIGNQLKAAAALRSKRMQGLELFRPFPYQDPVVLDRATEMLVQGGTRSGKSVIIAAMVAAFIQDMAITLSCGVKVPIRPEQYKGRDVGEIWVIGKQTNHSRTIYRLLFQSGAFPIVRDKDTRQWRALQPTVIPGDDKIPEAEWRPSPPFIFPGDVKFGWESFKEKTWKTAELPNGWRLCFYPSTGEPKRGDPVHVIWIDEEIEGLMAYYEELQSRLSDYKGRIWWSSWADVKCPPLLALYRRAEDQRFEKEQGIRETVDVTRHRFVGSENPIIDENEKRKRSEGWSEETRRARDEGHFITDTIQTYPEFDRGLHTVEVQSGSTLDDPINKYLREHQYLPGPDWCVDFIIDPGTQRPAGLWGAIPPPKMWPSPKQPVYVVFAELNIPRLKPEAFAWHVRTTFPGRRYCRFIIDKKAGDQTTMAASYQVQQIIAMAFAKERLRCQVSGDIFLQGDPVWIVRSMKLRSWLNGRVDGVKPQFRVVTSRCPGLVKQLETNLREVSKEDVRDKRAGGQVQDLLDCLEYWAGNDPTYIPPEDGSQFSEDPGMRAFAWETTMWGQVISKPRKEADRSSVICGIP